LKTAKYFDEYNEYVTGQRENINKLEKERQELTQRIKEDKVNFSNAFNFFSLLSNVV
jgi:formiminotetrahydrofolate cyclodeaminase